MTLDPLTPREPTSLIRLCETGSAAAGLADSLSSGKEPIIISDFAMGASCPANW